ncbi:MAG: hypothetical protein H6712_22175 [Myxococcales bacterium]|nr:hypothetical protein [Myxococcales bacterium]MCB9716582.1 hypothetical protein [Myxococcales bacterium]
MLTARTTLAFALLASILGTGCDMLEGDGIGRDGGVVVSEDGRVAVEIPAGALDETVEITIEVVPGPEGAASDLYVLQPIGLTFDVPVLVEVDYDDEMLGGRDAEGLTLIAKHDADWAYLGDQLVDDEDQVVSASLMALSPITVVVED